MPTLRVFQKSPTIPIYEKILNRQVQIIQNMLIKPKEEMEN